MTNSAQHRGWISSIRLGAASAAMALVIGLVLGIVTTQSTQAKTFTVLYNFQGPPDGAWPEAVLVRDAAGTLYGTAYEGGFSNYGVVFKLDTSGTETVLHSFTGGSDGGYSFTGVIRDTNGNLYGTTEIGGSSDEGTVFKVDTSGKESVLYSFVGGSSDGCYPLGGLIRDKSGNLYGTTGDCGSSGYGVVFKLDTSGTETVLHNFAGGARDGAYPQYASVLIDKKDNLYGITPSGGSFNEGVVYRLSKAGKLTVLHSFAGGTTDGCTPYGTPVMDKKGTLYGTTDSCGSSSLDGTVWKVSKRGTETVLHTFAGYPSDGASPIAGVILGTKGNLYGDTEGGGASREGMVYRLSKSRTLTVLHSFSNLDGAFPFGDVLQDAKGGLYGTALSGGTYGYGTVWKLTP